MDNEINMLPDTIDELKAMIASLQSENKRLNRKVIILEEKIRAAFARFFSPSKDKRAAHPDDQLLLFNETEAHADTDPSRAETEAHIDAADTTIVKEHARRKGGKRRIPDDIPAEEIVYELADEQKRCACCGKSRPVIGEDKSEELDIIPAQIKKIVHVVKKYGPCACDGFLHSGEAEVKRAVKPERFIPYSIVSPGLAAYCIDYKYNYAMPYYRLSKKFEALGMDISRATLCNWTMLAAERCRPLYELMLGKIREGSVINMDETRIQVLHEDGKTAESLSYMWVMKGGAETKKLTVFQYEPSRSARTALKLLEGFHGFLQTDGYEGYSKAVEQYQLVSVACLAHIRRKFVDAHKANGKSKTARSGVQFIGRIYSIENRLRKKNLPPGEFAECRRKETRPVLEEFKRWLDEAGNSVLPESLSGKAVSYALGQWERFVRFLDHPDLTPDNNTVENAIRPFALGRKNWLFSNTPRGAESSAVLYSIVESAKNCGLPVYAYLRHLFTRIPSVKTPDELETLLPCYLSTNDLKL